MSEFAATNNDNNKNQTQQTCCGW